MKDTQATPGTKITTKGSGLFMAMELSSKNWKLCFSDGTLRYRQVNVSSISFRNLVMEVQKAKKRFGLPEESPVHSCYEAGRDGFWIHRYLEDQGIDNCVVDSSSIEVPRRGRNKKTDRLDAESLVRMLIRYHAGESRVWRVVHVPSPEAEDGRRAHRELERLKKERTAHTNRIRSLLVLHGLHINPNRNFLSALESARLWDGSALKKDAKAELEREYQRRQQVNEQIQILEKEREAQLQNPTTPAAKKVLALLSLRGIGKVSAWTLTQEFFGWRTFQNRREVGNAAGLTGTPRNSGDDEKELGISKAGNRRVRAVMIELAWRWVRFQPGSVIVQWFEKRFAHAGKRMRRVGIVAVARQLLIALWRYVEFGIVPEGAVFSVS